MLDHPRFDAADLKQIAAVARAGLAKRPALTPCFFNVACPPPAAISGSRPSELTPCFFTVACEELDLDDAAQRERLAPAVRKPGWLWRFGADPVVTPVLTETDIAHRVLAGEVALGPHESLEIRHVHAKRWRLVTICEFAPGAEPPGAVPALSQAVETLVAGAPFRFVHLRYWTFGDGPARARHARFSHACNDK